MSKHLKLIFILVSIMVAGVLFFLKKQYTKADEILNYLPAKVDNALYIKTPTIVNGLMKYPSEKLDTLMQFVKSYTGMSIQEMHNNGAKPYSGVLYMTINGQSVFLIKLSNAYKFNNALKQTFKNRFDYPALDSAWAKVKTSNTLLFASKHILFGFPNSNKNTDTSLVYKILNNTMGKPTTNTKNHFNSGGHFTGLINNIPHKNNANCKFAFKCIIGVGSLKIKASLQPCKAFTSFSSTPSFKWDARKKEKLPLSFQLLKKTDYFKNIQSIDYQTETTTNNVQEINLKLNYKSNNFALDKALNFKKLLY